MTVRENDNGLLCLSLFVVRSKGEEGDKRKGESVPVDAKSVKRTLAAKRKSRVRLKVKLIIS